MQSHKAVCLFIIFIFIINSLSVTCSEPKSGYDTKVNLCDHGQNLTPVDLYFTRANSNSTHSFYYYDETEDVHYVDHITEPYTENSWYDIKSIVSQPTVDRIWVNMTMFDNIQDDEKIYYKLKVADAEVILYQGLGEIIYKNSFENFVYYQGPLISANIDKNKLNYDIFSISGSVYREDTDNTYGDYIIQDEIGINEVNPENELELNYTDPKDDVLIAYTIVEDVSTKPEVDILSIELIDNPSSLELLILFSSKIKLENGYKYSISLGNSIFIIDSGTPEVIYSKGSTNPIPEYTIQNNKLTVKFISELLDFTTGRFEIESAFETSSQQSYRDNKIDEVPKYLSLQGEKLKLEINMFEGTKIVLRLYGTLNNNNTREIRAQIDNLGNSDGMVDEIEYEEFVTNFKKSYDQETFFEFYPTLDSTKVASVMSLNLSEVTGHIYKTTNINMEIKASFEFTTIAENLHNITLIFLTSESFYSIGRNFIFDFIYDEITFNFTMEYKYWEFVSRKIFPPILLNKLNVFQKKIIIDLITYELLKNRVGPGGKFGFFIDFNETAAKAEDDPKKGDNKDDGGFLPGFETAILMVAVSVIIFIYQKIPKLKFGKGKN